MPSNLRTGWPVARRRHTDRLRAVADLGRPPVSPPAPGDEKFGDPLSTAGQAPVEVIARGVSALQPGRESVTKELGLSALQVWQSLSEATGRGRGDLDVALLFTDLVGFSSWALRAGDAAVLELLREVGTAVEDAITSHDGRIVKRLGDGVMATFLSGEAAVTAARDAHDAVNGIKGRGVLATYARGYPLGPAPEARAATISAST